MKMILKTYKYRLYPSKEQEEILARYFGTVRFVYNHFLAERKRQYEEYGKSDNYYSQAKTLTNLKKQDSSCRYFKKERKWQCVATMPATN